jgi:hypothetical protein
MQRSECGVPSADTKEVLKLEKKLREMLKIEERVSAGDRVDPLQLKKLGRKAEVEAELAEARNIVSCETTTVASHEGWASDGFQEAAVGHSYADESAHGQRDESVHEQWQEGFHGWQQAFAVDGQAAMMGGVTPVVTCLVPVQVPGQVLMPVAGAGWLVPMPGACAGAEWLQPATPQADPEAAPQPVGLALPHGSAPHPAQQRHHGGRRRTADRARSAQQEYFNRVLADLDAGGAACTAALAGLVGGVRRLAMDGAGCHVVQKALEVADLATAAKLVQELHGHVLSLIRSPHGNYVVQKIVEVLPPGPADFVARELRGCAAEMARHRFGCRVIIRLMEHCADTLLNEGRAALVQELLAEVGSLCRHSYGHHVVKAILEHAHPVQRQRVLAFLCTGAADKAQERFHSYVVEAVLEAGAAEEVEHLAHALLGDTPADVISLSRTRYGSNILRILLRRQGAVSQKAIDSLRAAAPCLGQSPGGSRLLRDAGLLA